MRTLGASHAGRVRPNNQDAFICGTLTEHAAFAVVCDGMGGANGGNIASTIAVRVIANHLLEEYRDSADIQTVRALLAESVRKANDEVFRTAMDDFDLKGMGTTTVIAVVTDTQAYIAHVGDSRAYLVTRRTIEQVTEDHSVVQEMVHQGKITADQARYHPQKHFLTRAIGVEPETECSFTALPMPQDGTLLLCTDGLTNLVEPNTLQSLVRTFPFEEIPNKLINTANLAGGSDNITVVAVTHDEEAGGKH